jgi:hypothetical protein
VFSFSWWKGEAVACCAALTLLFAWTYRALGWAIPSRDEDFAPMAAWPPVDTPARFERIRPPFQAVAQVCMVVGIAWFVAGMLAMHVFGVLDPIRSVPADVVFHASGLWLATTGLALRFLPRRSLMSAT